MKPLNVLVTIIVLVILGSFMSCRKDKKGDDNTGHISMRLTDGPAHYDAVYIDIQEIQFKMEGRSDIVLLPYRRGLYDLLSFRNGVDTLLVNTAVPVGKVEQIRLILGPNNFVVEDGVSYPLKTPSAQESGVKLNFHTTIERGVSYTVWLDFDAGKSVKQTGSGKYQLKPVIRAYSAVTNGRIEGYILPLQAFATVYVSRDGEEAAAIPSDISGHFVISGLPEGHYDLKVEPGVPGYLSVTLGVDVHFGLVTNVGTIVLLP